MTDQHPHVQASFINAIREEGTKAEACDWLQKQWNETCALHAQLADAQGAQAMVVERAAAVAAGEVSAHGEAHLAPFVRRAIRALADTDGLALVRELRAEWDSFRAVLEGAGYGDVDSIAKNDVETSRALGGAVQALTLQGFAKREAERDRLAAANAVLEAKVAGLRDFIDDFAKAKIDALRYSPPCGSSPEDEPDPVVDAKTVWAWQADAKAALATQEAGNG